MSLTVLPRAVYQSRAEQVLEFLRDRLKKGSWKEALPAERQLASQLGVGRHTLRAALKTLEKEGTIRERSQRGTLLKTQGRKKKQQTISIGIIFNQSAKNVLGVGLIYLDELRYFFAQKGVEVVVHHTLYPPQRVSPRFRKMVTGFPHALWVLVSPSEAAEQWCFRHKIPALLVGNRIGEGGLPSVAVDTYAACRHAVGQMVASGHRRFAMLLPHYEKGEDSHGRIGFLEAIEDSPYRAEITGSVEIHRATKEGICSLLDRLLAMENRPTALLICRQSHYLTAHSHLLMRGINIPGELSLICRDNDVFFKDLVPEPSRYVADVSRMARIVARQAHRLIEGKMTPSAPEALVRIVPDFVKGGTLGPAPSDP